MTATTIEHGAIATPFGRDYWRAVGVQVWSDRLIHGLILTYAVAAGVLAMAIGETEKLVYFEYGAIWLRGLGTIVLVYLTLAEVIPSVRANPASPLARVRERLPDILNPRVAAAFVIVLGVILLKGSFTSVKNMLTDITTFHWDIDFAAMDRWLAGGVDPWKRLQPILGHEIITRGIQYAYAAGWMFMVCGVPAFIAASRRFAHLRIRLFLTYIFSWVVLGNILAGVFMSAGPVFYGHVTGDFARFAPQMDYLSFTSGMMHSSYDYQQTLWQIHLLDRVELGTGISAFPSLHLAMCTLFFLTGLAVHRIAAVVSGLFLLIILAGSVHLAWHYAVDGLFSIAVVTAFWFTVARVQRLMTKRQARA